MFCCVSWRQMNLPMPLGTNKVARSCTKRLSSPLIDWWEKDRACNFLSSFQFKRLTWGMTTWYSFKFTNCFWIWCDMERQLCLSGLCPVGIWGNSTADSAANDVLVCNTSDEHSSVQFSSRWYLCARKSPFAFHPSLRNFPKLPLKQFQCLSDGLWPFLVPSRKID